MLPSRASVWRAGDILAGLPGIGGPGGGESMIGVAVATVIAPGAVVTRAVEARSEFIDFIALRAYISLSRPIWAENFALTLYTDVGGL